jgi:hypothetical protein
MKSYHYYFYFLKFIILLLIALVSLKIIPIRNKIHVIIDSIFKFSLGIFIILFFSNFKGNNLDKHDRIIIILSGFVLILLIDYIKLISVLFNNYITNDETE